MFSYSSYRVLFQSFFPQNISLLREIVTEAHANLKKKKTSCNATLKHNILLFSHGQVHPPLWNVRVFPVLFGSRWYFFHLFIIKVHMGCGALLHSAHFPLA